MCLGRVRIVSGPCPGVCLAAVTRARSSDADAAARPVRPGWEDLNDADRRVLERGLQRMNLNGRAGRVGRRLGEQRHAEARRDELADAAGAVGLERDAGREAHGGGRGDEQRVQAAAGRQADERLVAHRGQRRGRGEAPAGRGDQDQVLGGQRLGSETLGQVVVHGPDDHVDRAGVKLGEQLGDQPGPQGERDPGVAAVKPRERPGQVDGGQDQRRADAEVPAQHGGQLVQVGTRTVELVEHRAGAGQEELSSVGERDAAGRPLQQDGAQLGLQPPDLGGHGRLGDAQLLGGPAESAVPRDGLEVDELPQLHHFRVIAYKSYCKLVLDL